MEKIAIHEKKNLDKVVKFIELDQFTEQFQKEYNNGNVHGVYYEDDRVVAQLNGPEELKDILK